MQINRPFNNDIIVVSEFLSHSEANLIDFFLKGLKEYIWQIQDDELPQHLVGKAINIRKLMNSYPGDLPGIVNISILLSSMTSKLTHILESLELMPEGAKVLDFNQITRMTDSGMDLHSDNSDDESKKIYFGAVCYLNDKYLGGEISYPGLDIVYKPTARDLIIHPATDEYSHKVEPVQSGERYALPTFILEK